MVPLELSRQRSVDLPDSTITAQLAILERFSPWVPTQERSFDFDRVLTVELKTLMGNDYNWIWLLSASKHSTNDAENDGIFVHSDVCAETNDEYTTQLDKQQRCKRE
jgi:hypothetical protein